MQCNRNFVFIFLTGFLLISCETTGNALEKDPFPSSMSSSEGKRADPDAANWDIDRLDTARDVTYLSEVEKDVILEMNKARDNPKKYAELYIQPRLKNYSGRNYSVPGKITRITQEGAAAVNNCISSMSRMQSVGLLVPELGMSLAAKDHVQDQGRTRNTGHTGSDRSDPFKRMERYGTWLTTAGENISYGESTGRDIVVALLIDDGVSSRGHRTNIMSKDFSKTGVSVGSHQQYESMCVINYAQDYRNK